MFEVGFTEIILIFGIALLVLGPARLPKLAADLGRWAGRARAMARTLRTQLEQEVQFDPLAPGPAKAASGAGPLHTPPPGPDDHARAAPAQPATEATAAPANPSNPDVAAAAGTSADRPPEPRHDGS